VARRCSEYRTISPTTGIRVSRGWDWRWLWPAVWSLGWVCRGTLTRVYLIVKKFIIIILTYMFRLLGGGFLLSVVTEHVIVIVVVIAPLPATLSVVLVGSHPAGSANTARFLIGRHVLSQGRLSDSQKRPLKIKNSSMRL
jgi:hypothetical protein